MISIRVRATLSSSEMYDCLHFLLDNRMPFHIIDSFGNPYKRWVKELVLNGHKTNHSTTNQHLLRLRILITDFVILKVAFNALEEEAPQRKSS